MKDRITVHIVTKDRPAELFALLESLRVQSFVDWDLILVDESRIPMFNYHFITKVVNQIKLAGHKIVADHSRISGVVANRNQAFELEFRHFDNMWSCRIDDDSVLEGDYLERLVRVARKKKAGAVGGVVPLYGVPAPKKNPDVLNGVFNRISFSKEGNMEIFDDGGVNYTRELVLPSHHLRSSFLILNKAAREVGFYDTAFQGSAFREETDFCLKLVEAGYKLFTDIGAVCFHLRSPSGGLRFEDYERSVSVCDDYFRKKWKEKHGGGAL